MHEKEAAPWRNNLGFLVNRLSANMRAAFETRLGPHRISRLQWVVLRDLFGSDQQPALLAAHVGCDRAVMTRVLEELEKRGLVKRRISKQDRRRIDVSLTERGRLLTEQLIAISRSVNEQFLAPLSKKEAAELVRLMHLVVKGSESGSQVA